MVWNKLKSKYSEYEGYFYSLAECLEIQVSFDKQIGVWMSYLELKSDYGRNRIRLGMNKSLKKVFSIAENFIESLHVATDKNLGEESRTFEWITGRNGSSQLKEV